MTAVTHLRRREPAGPVLMRKRQGKERGRTAGCAGHRGDGRKSVRVTYQVGPWQVLAEVEDQGPGFDPSRVPDPTAPENLDKPCGRGLFLMRHYMTWVYHSSRGNCVTLCRSRSPDSNGST